MLTDLNIAEEIEQILQKTATMFPPDNREREIARVTREIVNDHNRYCGMSLFRSIEEIQSEIRQLRQELIECFDENNLPNMNFFGPTTKMDEQFNFTSRIGYCNRVLGIVSMAETVQQAKKRYDWTDNKTDLAELIWALVASKRIIDTETGKHVTQEKLVNHFEQLFGEKINMKGLMQGRTRSRKASEDGETFMQVLLDLMKENIKKSNEKK